MLSESKSLFFVFFTLTSNHWDFVSTEVWVMSTFTVISHYWNLETPFLK